MKPLLRKQTRDIRGKTRGLLVHWHKPVLVERRMKRIASTRSGERALRELLNSPAGKNLKNGEIVRMGFVARVRSRKKVPRVEYPISKMGFFDWLRSSRSKEIGLWVAGKQDIKRGVKSTGKSMRPLDRKAHQRFGFNIGINAIIEVGNDGKGNPTHILVLHRSPHVPEMPNAWDFPAGLIRAGSNPLDVVKERAAKELGLDAKKLSLIGPGLKPTKQEIWFALHRIDARADYDSVVILRTDQTAREVKKVVGAKIREGKKERNTFAPVDFKLLRRNPREIQRFIRNQERIFLPDVLRLYAQELHKNVKKR